MSEARLRQIVRNLLRESPSVLSEVPYGAPTRGSGEEEKPEEFGLPKPGGEKLKIEDAEIGALYVVPKDVRIATMGEYTAGGNKTKFSTVANYIKAGKDKFRLFRLLDTVKISNPDNDEAYWTYGFGNILLVDKPKEPGELGRIYREESGQIFVVRLEYMVIQKGQVLPRRTGSLPAAKLGAPVSSEWINSSNEIHEAMSPEVKSYIQKVLQPTGKKVSWTRVIDDLTKLGFTPSRRNRENGALTDDPVNITEDFEAEDVQAGRGERLLSFIFPNLVPVGGAAAEAGVDIENSIGSPWPKAEVKEGSFRIGAKGRTAIQEYSQKITPFMEKFSELHSEWLSGEAPRTMQDKAYRDSIEAITKTGFVIMPDGSRGNIDDDISPIPDDLAGLDWEEQLKDSRTEALRRNIRKYVMDEDEQSQVEIDEMTKAMIDGNQSAVDNLIRQGVDIFVERELDQTSTRLNKIKASETAASHLEAISEHITAFMTAESYPDEIKEELRRIEPYGPFIEDKEALSEAMMQDLEAAVDPTAGFGEDFIVIIVKPEFFVVFNSSDMKEKLESTLTPKIKKKYAKALGLAFSRITQGGQKFDITHKIDYLEDMDINIEELLVASRDLFRFRSLVSSILQEELTRSDKNDIERIARKQAKKYFDQQISKAIDTEIGKSFFGTRGKINKHVDDAITGRFKNANKDKDFDIACQKVAKRVLKAMHDMHFKRRNLIDDMPVPNK